MRFMSRNPRRWPTSFDRRPRAPSNRDAGAEPSSAPALRFVTVPAARPCVRRSEGAGRITQSSLRMMFFRGAMRQGEYAMDTTTFSAFAALVGSLIGGLTSMATSWLAERGQFNAGQIERHRRMQTELYRSFIEEASRRYA